MFSRRSGTAETRENALSRALRARRAVGAPLLDLTVSNPTTAGIPYAEDAIVASLADRRSLRYEPASLGLPEARAAVAKELGVPAERVLLTASTSEAYSFLFKLLCDSGDEVLVPRPSYPLFDQLAELDDVRLVPYRLAYDGAWHVDLPSLESAVTARTRAILVVSPNNPTGTYLRRAELERMEALGLPILCDEVFASYTLDLPAKEDVVRCAAREARSSLVFSLGGLSKLAGLPQMKAAWITLGGDGAKVGAAMGRLEWIADAYLSVGAPVQHALPRLLEARGITEQAIAQRVRANLRRVQRQTAGTAVTALTVEGGWYAVLRLPRTETEEAYCLSLLEDDGVLVQPGYFFDFPEEAYVVVSLLTPEADLEEGLARIVRRMR